MDRDAILPMNENLSRYFEDMASTGCDPIFTGYRGSLAHGMYVPPTSPNAIDDVDIISFVFGPVNQYIGLSKWGDNDKGTITRWYDNLDTVTYEFQKTLRLLLQGNPNILGTLWMRENEIILNHYVYRELRENRRWFVGQHVRSSFVGYAYAQLQKMESRDPADMRLYLALTAEAKRRGIHPTDDAGPQEYGFLEAKDVSTWSSEKIIQRLRSFWKKGENMGYLGDKRKQLLLEHGYDAKNAAHCIRLLRMGKEFLETGEMMVYRPDAAELLDIKAGRWTLEEIKACAQELFDVIENSKSPLPRLPDYDAVEQFCQNSLREYINGT